MLRITGESYNDGYGYGNDYGRGYNDYNHGYNGYKSNYGYQRHYSYRRPYYYNKGRPYYDQSYDKRFWDLLADYQYYGNGNGNHVWVN